MTAKRFVGAAALAVLISACFVPAASAQYSASGDLAFASKYIWRGIRVTDEPVLQPSMTLGIGNFSFNAWANMDLTGINDISPTISSQGKFTEIDYTFAYDQSFDDISISGGLIFYTFDWLFFPTTAEIFGGVTFDSVPASPSVTLYVDVDETSAGAGSTGLYILLAAGHTFETGNDVVTGVDVSGTFAFANSGYTNFYFGPDGGATDASVTVSVPFEIDDNWSASGFFTYSGLIRDSIRAAQYSAGGIDDADTFWGGATLSLSF